MSAQPEIPLTPARESFWLARHLPRQAGLAVVVSHSQLAARESDLHPDAHGRVAGYPFSGA